MMQEDYDAHSKNVARVRAAFPRRTTADEIVHQALNNLDTFITANLHKEKSGGDPSEVYAALHPAILGAAAPTMIAVALLVDAIGRLEHTIQHGFAELRDAVYNK